MTRADEPDFDALRVATITLRVARGLSVDALHEKSGIARSMLFRIENGTAEGTLSTWFRIAKALDVPLAELVQHLEARSGNTTHDGETTELDDGL